ncbi:GntR family transcriptional regulator [Streptomyces liangshanensis]|uniref:GntR family transcriptional regulator n=1 Tax=Streptomyces liangshanensis TaxID=2717324 RepID=A0A6G9H3E6_9ACTN|nr:GntR family transcriptional regulator [Streptomyces liangshanensis]QIQ04637.1 GntR family transcriptional regulator [Streptomyces liangshanensis]
MPRTTPPPSPPPPPYLRIVADIRRRIAEGELAPGDRVPSTRQIAREWGVALATATKALTRLSRDGLVEARPRVGTVVAAGPGRAGGGKERRTEPPLGESPRNGRRQETESHDLLTQERIVEAAVEIADAEGLAALSMRGVAARLGVAAMSPYRYVDSKEDLVLLMADAAFGEAEYPDAADVPDDWRGRVELGTRTLWRLYRKHPWLAQLHPLTRPLMLPNLMVHAEWMLSALEGHGLDPVTMFDLHVLLYSYVQGLAVNLEREAQAAASTGLTEDEWLDGQAAAMNRILTSPRYPAVTRVITGLGDHYDLDLDALLEFGLRPLLDGIAGIVEART